MLAVMANRQDAHQVIADDAEQNRAWKAVHETPTNLMLHNWMLHRIFLQPSDGPDYFSSQRFPQAGANRIVIGARR